VPIGRPAKFWRLTREADHLFPEAYAKLSVALIDSVKDAFGDGVTAGACIESSHKKAQSEISHKNTKGTEIILYLCAFCGLNSLCFL
jgi:predicted ArsR family transcriptional regulator